MCKITDIKTGIKKLDFAARRGKMTVYLTDGREVIVPLSFFPEIKKLSLKERPFRSLQQSQTTFRLLRFRNGGKARPKRRKRGRTSAPPGA